MDAWVLMRHTKQVGECETSSVNGVFSTVELAKASVLPMFEWTPFSEDGSFTGTSIANVSRDLEVFYTLELHTVDDNVN